MRSKPSARKVKQRAQSVVFGPGRAGGGVVIDRGLLGNPVELVTLTFMTRFGVTSQCVCHGNSSSCRLNDCVFFCVGNR